MQHDTTILTVFGNIMEVVPADDNRSVHFGRHNLPSQNTATDRNVSGEGAFLIFEVVSLSAI